MVFWCMTDWRIKLIYLLSHYVLSLCVIFHFVFFQDIYIPSKVIWCQTLPCQMDDGSL